MVFLVDGSAEARLSAGCLATIASGRANCNSSGNGGSTPCHRGSFAHISSSDSEQSSITGQRALINIVKSVSEQLEQRISLKPCSKWDLSRDIIHMLMTSFP